ncbi:MAG: GTP 3',8-cyclase MoaA [Candidatus Bathyarchaeota archaeon]|nr:GTP 3',8-cyclase MoaA [Candidatus Bathyarchaeota archaeon]
MEPLVDPHGRHVSSLRISVTQRCDLACFFCHREGEHDPGKEMAPGEIGRIVEVAAELGVTKVKVTGGEPLMRGDIVEVISLISPHVREVSMTTNALLLPGRAAALRDVGLKRVNISLHSLKRETVKKIAGVDCLDGVKEGIRAADEAGLKPIKLNFVVMKGLNSDEVPDMLRLSAESGAILQLIEYQSLERGVERWGDLYYDLTPLERVWDREAVSVEEQVMHKRKRYTLADGATVEIVRPIHNTVFCANCNRLRLTSDGRLKPCLMRGDNLVPVVQLLRRGAGKEELVDAFRLATSRRAPYWSEDR